MRRYGRVLVVLAIQLAILVAIPARQVRARLRGTPITLRTAPVDPVDVLSGHYLTLSYEIEGDSRDRAEPGLRGLQTREDVWLTVARGEPAWTLVSVTREKPAPASGRVSIRGRWRPWGRAVLEGAGRIYVSEETGSEIDAHRTRRAELVDLRVDEDGTPAVVRLRGPGFELRAE